MTPIEIMALIFAIAILVKILVFVTNPRKWLKIVKPLYANPVLLAVASLVLAAISLNYLLQELTIIQIAATMLFIAFLAAISMASYSKEVFDFAEKLLSKETIKKARLSIIIWVLLAGWVLDILFA